VRVIISIAYNFDIASCALSLTDSHEFRHRKDYIFRSGRITLGTWLRLARLAQVGRRFGFRFRSVEENFQIIMFLFHKDKMVFIVGM